MRWEGELLIEDRIVNLFVVLGVEWWKPSHKFIEKSPNTVIIDGKRVSSTREHFGSHILWTATKRIRNRFAVDVWFSQSKVSDTSVPILPY